MADAGSKQCPVCEGKKVIKGTCECDMEWRGNRGDEEEWEDCQCVPELPCPNCHSTGVVK